MTVTRDLIVKEALVATLLLALAQDAQAGSCADGRARENEIQSIAYEEGFGFFIRLKRAPGSGWNNCGNSNYYRIPDQVLPLAIYAMADDREICVLPNLDRHCEIEWLDVRDEKRGTD